jgi:hypothetical protein
MSPARIRANLDAAHASGLSKALNCGFVASRSNSVPLVTFGFVSRLDRVKWPPNDAVDPYGSSRDRSLGGYGIEERANDVDRFLRRFEGPKVPCVE